MLRLYNKWVFATLFVWLLCVAAWSLLLTSDLLFGCPEFTPGGSNTGNASWQWLPPGNRCTYLVPTGRHASITHIENPPTARDGILGPLILWPVSVLIVGRRDESNDASSS
jgi:hypothetical protein